MDILTEQLENNGKISSGQLEEILSKYGEVQKDEEGNIIGVKPEGKEEIPIEDIIEDSKITDGGNEEQTEIKVGDYVNYIPDSALIYSVDKLAETITGSNQNRSNLTQDTLNWQVLRIYEDGSMDLIGSPTSQKVYFKGALGYNNGVYVMNDICKSLYSKPTKGITARSINDDDFYKWLTPTGQSYIQPAITKQYTGEQSYMPCIYGKTENGSDPYYNTPTTLNYKREFGTDGKTYTLNATQSGHYLTPINETHFGEGQKVLSNDEYYWVATRGCEADDDIAGFDLSYAYDYLYGEILFYSDNRYAPENMGHYGRKLRPIISLGSDVQVTLCNGTNSATNMHTINW